MCGFMWKTNERIRIRQTIILLWRSDSHFNELVIQPHVFQDVHGPPEKRDSSTDSGDCRTSFKYLHRESAILSDDQC